MVDSINMIMEISMTEKLSDEELKEGIGLQIKHVRKSLESSKILLQSGYHPYAAFFALHSLERCGVVYILQDELKKARGNQKRYTKFNE
jgi:hypothetical protein